MCSPNDLPIWRYEQAILEGLRTHRVLIVAAETGSGKSTQIPQMLLGDGYTDRGLIGISEPRRVAASATAKRVASEMGLNWGREIGFQVRHHQEVSAETVVKFATEGIFLQEAKSDPRFSRYSVIMLDEFHERSANVDVLLGLLKQALEVRDDLRLVVSSATLNIPRLAGYFGDDAVVVECEGRVHPVEKIFLQEPLRSVDYYDRRKHHELAADAAIAKVVDLVAYGNPKDGDILVFVPGYDSQCHIRREIEKQNLEVGVLLAHGGMSLEELEKILEPHESRRVIVATNVAETSLTIPGVTTVIDTGFVKQEFYDEENGLSSLVTTTNSRASVEQRAGRAGRLSPGTCYCMFTEDEFDGRKAFDEPEILRSELASVVMILAKVGVCGIDALEAFPFLDKPENGNLGHALTGLMRMGAVGYDGQLTEYGERLSRFPLAPSTAHLLLKGAEHSALDEMATLIAMLETWPLPRMWNAPDEKNWRGKAFLELVDEVICPESDVELLLSVCCQYTDLRPSEQWAWARENGLNPLKMQEVVKVREQLLAETEEQGLERSGGSSYPALKKALISARLGGVATHYDRGFCNQDNRCFYVFPGSAMRNYYGRIVWTMGIRRSDRTLFGHCCMPVKLEDLLEIPGAVTTTICLRHRVLEEGMSVYKNYKLGSMTVGQKEIDDNYPCSSSFGVPRYGTLEISPEEWERLQAQATHREKLEGIIIRAQGLQVIPSDVEISDLGIQIVRICNREDVGDEDIDEAQELLEILRARHNAVLEERRLRLEEERAKRREEAEGLYRRIPNLPDGTPYYVVQFKTLAEEGVRAWIESGDEHCRSGYEKYLDDLINAFENWKRNQRELEEIAAEHERRLDECRQVLDMCLELDMSICPFCGSALTPERNRCGCVNSMTRSQLGIRNGSGEVVLRELNARDDYGREVVLSRIVLSCRPNADLAVVRTVEEVISPFNIGTVEVLVVKEIHV